MNFYKHYLGDYSRKTAHLSLIEHGSYHMLLGHYYGILGPIPNDEKTWFRITRAVTQEETQAVIKIMNEFFPLRSDGMRHNKRADEECKAWLKQAEFNRKVGALGGRPKNPTANPTANPRKNPHQKLEVRRSTKTLADRVGLFDQFWTAYPRKAAKQSALKAWAKLTLSNGDFEHILIALSTACQSDQWRNESGKYIPHAATWLNGKRWEDQPTVQPEEESRMGKFVI